MLILTRRVGETLVIGDDVTVTVLGVRGNQVRLGVNAPKDVAVHREEIYQRIQNEKDAAEKRFNGGNIMDENISRDTNAPATLSMANCGSPNTGGSQFFLNVNNNANLDWFSPGASKHPVFGKITAGYDVVVAISKVPTRDDNPVTPIMMNSITITGI